MRVLGVDYGDRRTGIAVSEGLIAFPVRTIVQSDVSCLIDEILGIIKEYSVSKVVIGKPLNMNGTAGERAEKAVKFAEKLGKVSGLEIELIDERLTTVSATKILNESNFNGTKKRKNVIDTLSAVIILQSYLEKRR